MTFASPFLPGVVLGQKGQIVSSFVSTALAPSQCDKEEPTDDAAELPPPPLLEDDVVCCILRYILKNAFLSQSSSQDHLEHRVVSILLLYAQRRSCACISLICSQNLGLRDQRLHPHFRTVVWGHVPQLQVPLLNKQKSTPKYRLLPRP